MASKIFADANLLLDFTFYQLSIKKLSIIRLPPHQ
jgi:hypothetical protein